MNLKKLIDNYGALKAEFADLKKREGKIKAALADLAPGFYEGKLFRLDVSVYDRTTVDAKALREKFGEKFVLDYSKTTYDIRKLEVTARNGVKVAA